MLCFTAEGARSVDDRDVIAVYCAPHDGWLYTRPPWSWARARRSPGRALVTAVSALESKLCGDDQPPLGCMSPPLGNKNADMPFWAGFEALSGLSSSCLFLLAARRNSLSGTCAD
jgi:hypothetical protein